MADLLLSRRSKQQVSQRLTDLSPQKYGKAAFCELNYTPSKLVDNVLFRQATQLRRIQEESSRIREYEAENVMLSDSVEYLKRERDGIEQSLNGIISMYKGIIAEMQRKQMEQIKNIQRNYSEHMQKIIADKQQEAKYNQSEKELLESRIQQLERGSEELKQENTHLKEDGDRSKVALEKESQRLSLCEAAMKDQHEQFQREKMEWKIKMNQAQEQGVRRQEQKDEEMGRVRRIHEGQVKQLKQNSLQLRKELEGEIRRLIEVVGLKEKMVEMAGMETEKALLEVGRQREVVGDISRDKNMLIRDIHAMEEESKFIIRQRRAVEEELERENQTLRELLMESSDQLEKCKKEFIMLGRDNEELMGRLKRVEEEAKTWKDSYHLNRSRK